MMAIPLPADVGRFGEKKCDKIYGTACGSCSACGAIVMRPFATDTWTTGSPMVSPRHGTGAAALDGVLYMPGGASVQAFGAVATVESVPFP